MRDLFTELLQILRTRLIISSAWLSLFAKIEVLGTSKATIPDLPLRKGKTNQETFFLEGYREWLVWPVLSGLDLLHPYLIASVI